MKNIYLLSNISSLPDIQAAAELLREKYTVIQCDMAPLKVGLLYETAEPVLEEDQEALGLVTWR